jgi:hypothetical protein
MLDFYFIKDDQIDPSHPGELGLEFAGGLDIKIVARLQQKGVIDQLYDYSSDFRLGTLLIKQIRQIISQKSLQADSDVKELMQLFDLADRTQSGLIVFGD